MADDQPPLPHGINSLPSAAALALLPPLLSSVSDLNEGLVGRSLLVEAMSRHIEKPAASNDVATAFDAAISELLGAGLVLAHGDAPKRPGLDLGIGKSLPMPSRPGQPTEGEPTYGVTALGRRLYFYHQDRINPGSGYGMFPPERLADQILVYARHYARRDAVEARLYWLSPEEARARVDELIATGDVDARPNGTLIVQTHADPKAVRFIKEHQQRLAARDLEGTFGRVANAAAKTWTLDVSFLPPSPIRGVIEHDLCELAAAMSFSLHTASLVLAGAIAEGLLLEALALDTPRAEGSKKRTSKKPLDEWMLNELIVVAEDLGAIGRSTAAAAHLELREFRNLIHPRVQVRVKLRPTAFAVESSRRMLEQMVAELRPLFP